MAKIKQNKKVITIAFTQDNLDFLDSVTKLIGTDRTSYLNTLVYKERMSYFLKDDEIPSDQEKIECVPTT